jgi:hypothetical protein
MKVMNIRWTAWSNELEKKVERLLRTGLFIMIGAITCLLAVFWYITPH